MTVFSLLVTVYFVTAIAVLAGTTGSSTALAPSGPRTTYTVAFW